MEVLLAAGVDVNTRTSAGTAMHEAALCGKMEVVRALLDRGVDLGIRDSRQNTVLDLLGQFPPHVTQDITAVIKSAYPPALSLSRLLHVPSKRAVQLTRRISGGEKRRVSRRAVTRVYKCINRVDCPTLIPATYPRKICWNGLHERASSDKISPDGMLNLVNAEEIFRIGS